MGHIADPDIENGLFMNHPGLPLDGSGKPPAKPSEGYRRYSKAAEIVMKHPVHEQNRAWSVISNSPRAEGFRAREISTTRLS